MTEYLQIHPRTRFRPEAPKRFLQWNCGWYYRESCTDRQFAVHLGNRSTWLHVKKNAWNLGAAEQASNRRRTFVQYLRPRNWTLYRLWCFIFKLSCLILLNTSAIKVPALGHLPPPETSPSSRCQNILDFVSRITCSIHLLHSFAQKTIQLVQQDSREHHVTFTWVGHAPLKLLERFSW